MEGCSFHNNCAVNGGAVTWMGDNGTIDNCYFANNAAKGVGGVLYIGGTNNTVSNRCLANSSSQLSCEAIYMGCNRNISFVNDTFTDSYLLIEGAVVGIGADYSKMTYAYGNLTTSEGYQINNIPLIYKAIVNGDISNINDFVKNYSQYNMKTHLFPLNIAAFEELTDSQTHMDLDYLKSICFYNVADINQVIDGVIHGNCKFDISHVLTGYVSNTDEYNRSSHASAFGLGFNTDEGVKTLSYDLKVIFTGKWNINSADAWNPKFMGYNVITIVGNCSTINGNAGGCDEKKWLIMDDEVTFIANDLIIWDVNTTVECLEGAG